MLKQRRLECLKRNYKMYAEKFHNNHCASKEGHDYLVAEIKSNGKSDNCTSQISQDILTAENGKMAFH